MILKLVYYVFLRQRSKLHGWQRDGKTSYKTANIHMFGFALFYPTSNPDEKFQDESVYTNGSLLANDKISWFVLENFM